MKNKNDATNMIQMNKLHPSLNRRNIEYQKYPGKFLKSCPGTTGEYLCCGYYVLNPMLNCSLGCTYCILRSYLNTEKITIYSNWKDIETELTEVSGENPQKEFRIGTGELADSLLLDPLAEFTKHLVPVIANLPNMVLELKTKTTNIDNLKNLDHKGRTVVAWSLSPQSIIERYEGTAATLSERIKAAEQVISWGYHVAFHFDPIINYPAWKIDYKRLIQKLFDRINPESIRWISLGTFRFPPHLEQILTKQQKKKELLLDEFILCSDGKYRYFWPIRTALLKGVYSFIKEVAPDVFVYICMERAKIWERTLGWAPSNADELNEALNKQIFPLLNNK